MQITTQEGKQVEVCSATFRSILVLGRKRLGNIQKYAWENNFNPRQERRGGRRESAEFVIVKDRIHTHIKSFRCCASHYGRNKTPYKRYLPASLNIQRMWELFKKENTDCQVTYHTYYNIFVRDFNLGFGSPKTDVCSLCTGLKGKIASETDDIKKRTLVTELMVHRTRARKFYQLMSAKEDESTLKVSFDLMQNQALPKTPIGEAYYARQLWLYVLGIVEHKPSGDQDVPSEQSHDDIHFFAWGEEEMGRGSNQVASALSHFLRLRLKDSPIKRVQLFSDSCVGQNKNSTVLGMLNMVATELNVEFEHIFPVRGHSYMPADRAFGRVEKRLRREETILLPSDYLDHFGAVGKVYVHGQDWHAYDLKDAMDQCLRKPLPFKITEAKRIVVSPATAPVTVCTFYSARGEKYSVLKRGKRWSAIGVHRLELESCVKPAKKKDVRDLLLAIGVDIDLDSEKACGPPTHLQAVAAFYTEVCKPTDAMDTESDDEEEAIVSVYDERAD